MRHKEVDVECIQSYPYNDRSIMGGRYSPSNAELIQGLRAAARKVGGTPTVAQAVASGKLAGCISLYIKRFGGWGDACEAAGIQRSKLARKLQSDRELIDDLVAEAKRRGHMPTTTSLEKSRTLSSSDVYYRRFNCRNIDGLTRLVVRWLREAGESALAGAIEEDLERRIAIRRRRKARSQNSTK